MSHISRAREPPWPPAPTVATRSRPFPRHGRGRGRAGPWEADEMQAFSTATTAKSSSDVFKYEFSFWNTYHDSLTYTSQTNLRWNRRQARLSVWKINIKFRKCGFYQVYGKRLYKCKTTLCITWTLQSTARRKTSTPTHRVLHWN